MVALGLWQLDRRTEKEVQLAVFRANLHQPAIAYPAMPPVTDKSLFRASSALCFSVAKWRTEAGRSVKGTPGYRWIAECRTGAEGPGLVVDMGVTRDPKLHPQWQGGKVSGIITTEPSHQSLFSRLGGQQEVLRPMLVSAQSAPGLEPSAPPSPEDVPNNHLAYAVQWFFFAATAAVIYLLALRRRRSRTIS
jgi:cytochrome oxidase assembly protein ShyY1